MEPVAPTGGHVAPRDLGPPPADPLLKLDDGLPLRVEGAPADHVPGACHDGLRGELRRDRRRDVDVDGDGRRDCVRVAAVGGETSAQAPRARAGRGDGRGVRPAGARGGLRDLVPRRARLALDHHGYSAACRCGPTGQRDPLPAMDLGRLGLQGDRRLHRDGQRVGTARLGGEASPQAPPAVRVVLVPHIPDRDHSRDLSTRRDRTAAKTFRAALGVGTTAVEDRWIAYENSTTTKATKAVAAEKPRYVPCLPFERTRHNDLLRWAASSHETLRRDAGDV